MNERMNHRLHDVMNQHRCLMVKVMMERYDQSCFLFTLLFIFEMEFCKRNRSFRDGDHHAEVKLHIDCYFYLMNVKLRCFLRVMHHCIWIVRHCC